MNFPANKKLFSSSKTSFQSYKSTKKLESIPSKPWESQPKWVLKQNWSIPETIQQQQQQQTSQAKETLKLVGPLKFHDYMLNELQKDVENFKGGNHRYFSKNWYKYTKNKYILA